MALGTGAYSNSSVLSDIRVPHFDNAV